MSQFIVFSAILFAVLLGVGTVMFILSMGQIISTNKGNELVQALEIERIKTENSVNAEITIALKLADSPLIHLFFENPTDPEVQGLAFNEMASYRRAFGNDSIFWINDIDRIFYSDGYAAYRVDPENPDNYWYYMTLHETDPYNFNINYNPDLNVTNLWINVPVFNRDRKPIGIVGTGMDLAGFIDNVYDNSTTKAEIFLFNSAGEITLAKDISMVNDKKNIDHELGAIDFSLMAKTKELSPGKTLVFDTSLGKMALGSVPMLGWYSVAVLPDSLEDYNTNLTVFFFVVVAIIALLFVVFNVFIAGLLSPLRRTLRALIVARDDAQRANKSKSNFLATMSHEIRTPMNAIIGIAQIRLQRGNLSDEYVMDMEKIYNSGSSLLGIINDILDMSKIETGKMELNPVDYDVPSLINDVVQLSIVRIDSKPIQFMLDVDEHLPSRMFGDELRIKQVLLNLLSNAIKYTQKGHVKLSVKHDVQGEDAMLSFAVEDTGQGLKPEDKEKLFSEYLRFNSEANRATEGTGIGLNITRKLVAMMEGNITVESEYGKGSVFTVTIRQKAVPCEAIGVELSQRLRKFAYAGEKKISTLQMLREMMPYGKVLVVDDVETNLYVAEGLMAPYELKIETALSGFAAIEKVESGKTYDVIFMDHMMPLMDGIETTQKLRALGYTGIIVALTANALVGNDELFKQNGFNDFIPKPIDIRKLNACLNKYVRDRHPEEAALQKANAKKPTNGNTSLVSSLSTVDGLKVVEAIETMGGLTEAYERTIRVFARNVPEKLEKMTEYLGTDIKAFAVDIHGMKGALNNVGAYELGTSASQLEDAAKSGDTAYCEENYPRFKELLADFHRRLNDALPAQAASTKAEGDKQFLFDMLEKAMELADDFDSLNAKKFTEYAAKYTYDSDTNSLLKEIINTLEDFDCEGAVSLMEKLRAEIKK